MANWLLSRLKRELHWTKFLFRSRDWRTVAFTPWLPYNWFQIVFIFARWVFAAYYLFVLIYMFAGSTQPRYLPLFLTVWGLLVWTLYLIVAALSSTAKFVLEAFEWCRQTPTTNYSRVDGDQQRDDVDGRDYEVVTWSSDRVPWYQKVHWILFYLGMEVQLAILILYWGLLYRSAPPETVYNFTNFNVHLTGGIVALLDLLIGGVIVSIYHTYVAVLFGIVYSVFTVVYYAAGGTDQFGNRYIYSVIDYGSSPGLAAGLVIATPLVLMPVVHLIVYTLACVRRWIVHHLRACLARRKSPAGIEAGSPSPEPRDGRTNVARNPRPHAETRFSEET